MEPKPATLLEAIKAYGDIDFALLESADSRWPKGVACAHCGADAPMFLKTRKIWKCSKCRKQFSFKAGTLLEDSPIGLDKWLPAIWMIANDRNGTSSWELHRKLGVTQKTAWFMLHRIRLAMQDETTGGKIGGPGKEVEADETMIGGKARNMHPGRRNKMRQRDNFGKATQVMATARMTVKDLEAVIDCSILHWLKRAGGSIPAKVESKRRFTFFLSPDMKSLKFRSEVLSPYDAAGKVLEATLLKSG